MPLTLRTALYYFLLVFTAGFILGTLRVLFLVNMLGERWAELIEFPMMAIVCAFAANHLVNNKKYRINKNRALAMGVLSLGMLLFVEFTVVLWLQGLSLGEYFSQRDPIAGIAYIIGLLWFAYAPYFFIKRRKPSIKRKITTLS